MGILQLRGLQKQKITRCCLGILVALLILLLVGGIPSVLAADYPDDYDIEMGTDNGQLPPAYADLKDGEIRTGKYVVHDSTTNTVTVTLWAWGKPFYDWDGLEYDPNAGGTQNKPLDDTIGGGNVTIVDRLFEFQLVPGSAIGDGSLNTTASGSGGGSGSVTWTVNQDDILDENGPATITYVLELGSVHTADPLINYWYSTGTAQARFAPVKGNPFYWTKEEITFNSFISNINWNNGNGMNSGEIIDNRMDVTITLGSHNSQENELPTDPGSHWAYTAHIGSTYYWWHLQWYKSSGEKDYFITIRDLEGPGIDVTYEIYLPGPGGNQGINSTRTETSTEYFQRHFEPGLPQNPFTWDGDYIVVNHNTVGELRIEGEVEQTGTMTIHKKLGGYWDLDWDVDGDTPFYVRLYDEDGRYMVFIPDTTPGVYIFDGTIGQADLASLLPVSENNPATILGIPVGTWYLEEVGIDFALVTVTFSYDEDGEDLVENLEISISKDEEQEIYMTNDFHHGVGFLEIHKQLDGPALSWWVDENTVFYAAIYDVEADNFLLFKENPESDGSFRCVGNTEEGLSEVLDDGEPFSAIVKFKPGTTALSNLWTWGSYEVIEIYNDPTSTEPRVYPSGLFPPGLFPPGLSPTETDLSDWVRVPVIDIDTDSGELTGDWLTDEDWTWGVTYSDNNGEEVLAVGETIIVFTTNHYKENSGMLEITKHLSGVPSDWNVDDTTIFYVRVYDVSAGNYLIFRRDKEPSGPYEGSYWCVGNDERGLTEPYYAHEPMREIPITAGETLLLSNLWASRAYRITEVRQVAGSWVEVYNPDSDWLDDPNAVLNHGVIYSDNNGEELMEYKGTLELSLTNIYKYNRGSLTVNKLLDGFPGNWNIGNDDTFFVRIWDIENSCYLLFKSTPETDGSYRCVGNTNGDVFDDTYTGTPRRAIPVSVNTGVRVSNVLAGKAYEVREFKLVSGTGWVRVDPIELVSNAIPADSPWWDDNTWEWGVSCSDNNEDQVVLRQSNITVTLTNHYKENRGTLQIRKLLGDNADDWEVGDNTLFYAKILDEDGNVLLFKNTPETAGNNIGSYRCIRNSNGDVFDSSYTGTLIERLPFSVNNPVKASNLMPGMVYTVEEYKHITSTDTWELVGEVTVSGGVITTPSWATTTSWTWGVSYENNGEEEIVAYQNVVVVLTNHYKENKGYLRIYKALAGAPGDWDIHDGTVFHVRIWDIDNGNYLLFKDVPEDDGTYRCIGNNVDGYSEVYLGTHIMELEVSVNHMLKLSNVWAGYRYRIEEIELVGDDWELVGAVEVNGSGVITTPGWATTESWTWGVAYQYTHEQLLAVGENLDVHLTNWYKANRGSIIINKNLDGVIEDWDIDEDSVFFVRIWDVENGCFMLFSGVRNDGDPYECIGSENDDLSAYPGIPLKELEVTAADPITLTNLPAGRAYEVWEVHATSAGWEPVRRIDLVGGIIPADSAWVTDLRWTWGVIYGDNNGDELARNEEKTIDLTNLYKEYIVYTVTYVDFDFTTAIVPLDANLYVSGEPVTVQGRNAARNNHVFLGWSLLPDGSGPLFSASDIFNIHSDVVLYAQWRPLQQPDDPPPHTGDISHSGLWMCSGITSLVSLGAVPALRRRRRNRTDQ